MRPMRCRGTAIDGIDGGESDAEYVSEQPQRWFIQCGALLAQGQDLFGPVTLAGEPGEMPGERRVIPAPGQPGAVVHQSQTAQGLNQRQLARVEVMEFVVAFDQLGQL